MNRKTLVSFALVAWVSCFAASAHAATITWDAAATNVDQNNVSQVKNNEYYFDAIALNTSRVLNGVQFHGFSGSTPVVGGNDLQFGTSHITIDNTDVTGPQSFSSTGTTPYGAMLNVGSYRSTGNTPGMSIELSGLTPGLQYQVQLWTPYWNNQFATAFSAGNTTPFLTTGFGTASPQFIIGTFTADSTTESITSAGNNGFALFSAISVRSTPEPSSILMAALGFVGLVAASRRRVRFAPAGTR